MLRIIRTLLIVILAIGGVLPVLSNARDDQAAGAVFVMTNAADKNEIIAYKRAGDGSLSDEHRFATGGRGSGGTTDPLASQGSLTLTEDHSFLLAANAGSGEISSFRVHGATLQLADVVPCGGSKPVSVVQRRDFVYVVNAGGNSNVVGFRLAGNGKLTQIPHSTTFLSTSNSGPGSVAFSPDGQFLVVTEKATNNIDAFRVQPNGRLGPIVINSSSGAGVFALLFAPNGAALASQTGPPAPAVSSYAVESNGTLSAISANVPTLGTATCWQAVTPDGRFVYTANSGSSSISGYSIGKNGALTPLPGTVVATLPTGSIDLDTTISSDGKFLYTLNSGTGTIGIFGIDADGTLSSLGEKAGLQASSGFNGIAAI